MTSVVAILSVGYVLIGQFYGFSLVLALSIGVSVASLFWKVESRPSETQGV